MKKFVLLMIGGVALLASGYFALTDSGSKPLYGALIAITLACWFLMSIKEERATARKPLSEYVSAVLQVLTLYDYMLLGGFALLLSALAVILPPVFIFVMAVFMSGAGVGLLFWVLSKHTRC